MKGYQSDMNNTAHAFLLECGSDGATFDQVANDMYKNLPVFVISRVSRTLNSLLSNHKIYKRDERYFAKVNCPVCQHDGNTLFVDMSNGVAVCCACIRWISTLRRTD